jgi:predicted transcriptional regulator
MTTIEALRSAIRKAEWEARDSGATDQDVANFLKAEREALAAAEAAERRLTDPRLANEYEIEAGASPKDVEK